jgi:hypothetical protein
MKFDLPKALNSTPYPEGRLNLGEEMPRTKNKNSKVETEKNGEKKF